MEIKDKSELSSFNRQSLSQKIIHSGIWAFVLRIAYQSLGFVRIIALARLLAPEDFGLFGIAMISISTLQSFSETGINAALVQKKKDIKSYLNTGWTIQIIRGVFLAAILLICAPIVASFFQQSKASMLLQVLAISVFFDGLQNIGIIYFRKDLKFHRLFAYQLIGAVVDLAVAIFAALLLRNVWALAYGILARSIVCCALSYVIHQYRPRLEFNIQKTRELYGFGRWILANRILNFLHLQGDDIFLGKVLGAVSLGFYQMAYRITNMPSTEITLVLSRVTFPAYSKIQSSIQELSRAFLKTLKLIAFVAIPLAGGIFILSPEFVRIFLGAKWMTMVPAMKILAVYGAVRAIFGTFCPLFYGMGKPRIMTRIRLIQLIFLALLIYPFALKWGVLGVAVAVTICKVIVLALAMKETTRILNLRLPDFSKAILIPGVSTVAFLLCLLLIQQIALSNIGLYSLIAMTFLSIALYIGCIYLFDRFSSYGIKGNLLTILKSI